MGLLSINSIIVNHLNRNRRLVVPGFGAFVVKETGEVIFSELLRTDDGVLMGLLLAEGLSQMEAAIVIDRYKFEVQHELQQYGYCQLDELGTLRLEENKQLKLYQLKPIQVDTPQSEEVAAAESEKVEEKEASEVTHIQEPQPQTQTPPSQPQAPQRPNRTLKPRRKGADKFIVVIAVVILLGAIAAIGYGVYVNFMTEQSVLPQAAPQTEIIEDINQQ